MTTTKAPQTVDFDASEYGCFIRFIVRIARLIIFPLFVVDEPFQQVLRKAAMLVLAAMGGTSWSKAPVMSIVASYDPDGGWTLSRIMHVVLSIHVVLHFDLFNYTFMRLTKTCPDWVADLGCLSGTLMMIEIAFIDAHCDMRSILIVISMLTAMCSTSRLPLHLAFQFAVYYFGYLRDYWQAEIPELKLDLDTTPTLFEKFYLLFIYSVVPVWMGVAGMHIIVSQYVKRNEEQRQNRKMTVEVAECLLVFDVDRLAEVLETYKNSADENLRMNFVAIYENLKLFRPHVPQYLIESAIRRMNADDDDDDEGKLESASESVTSHRPTKACDSSSDCGSSASSRSSANAAHMAHSLHHHQRLAITSQAFCGAITTAYFDFKAKPSTNGFAQLAASVDVLNAAATSTKTSIHTLHGDSVFASWNATSRTGNHAVNACMFAAAMMNEVAAAVPAFDITGSLVQCLCNTVFSGKKQAHLLLSGDGLVRHEAQRAIACDIRGIVCDQGVQANAETWGMFAGFALDADNRPIYDVIGPKSVEEEDEWMYQLQAAKDKTSPWEAVTDALLAVRNDSGADMKATLLARLKMAPEEVCERLSVKHFIGSLAASK